jgi:hypothetical protein
VEESESESARKLLLWGTAVVVGHFIAVAWHLVLLVRLHPETPSFLPLILILINLLPIVGLLAFAKGLSRPAAALITIPLGIALLIGLNAHFLSPGSDNVLHMRAGELVLSFQVSAALLVLLEALGCWIGIRMLLTDRTGTRHPTSTRP